MHGRFQDYSNFLRQIKQIQIDVIGLLRPANLDAKKEFLANPRLSRPHNIYNRIQPQLIKNNLDQILAFYEQLEQQNFSQPLTELAKLLLKECKVKNEFVLTNYEFLHAKNKNQKDALSTTYRHLNRELYGDIEHDVFWAILNQKLDNIRDQKIKVDLLASLTPPSLSKPVFQPKPETIAHTFRLLRRFFAKFLRHIPEGQETFTVQEACKITNQIIQKEFHHTQYRATVDPERTNAAVDHGDKTLYFPGKRSRGAYSRLDLEKIIVHELGTHILRATTYERLGLDALCGGMPGNNTFEEGLAKICEQAIANEYSIPGQRHYISIGLASILHLNFRQTFDIITKLENASNEKSRNICFDTVQRTFRGTDVLPNHKDLIYYNGFWQVWQFIEENINDPGLITKLFYSGKANLSDIDQEQLVYELTLSRS